MFAESKGAYMQERMNLTLFNNTDFIKYKNLKYSINMQLFKCVLNRDLFSGMEICSHYIIF